MTPCPVPVWVGLRTERVEWSGVSGKVKGRDAQRAAGRTYKTDKPEDGRKVDWERGKPLPGRVTVVVPWQGVNSRAQRARARSVGGASSHMADRVERTR